MFRRLSKHLEFRQKHSAARRIFNSLLGVSISQWNTVARVWYITSREYHHGHYVSCEKNFKDSLIYDNLIQCCGWQQQMNTKVQTLPQSVIVAFCLKIIINYNKLISFSCFSCGSSILVEPGENQQQTQTTYGTEPELEPRPHWWKASALTTAPTLLPHDNCLAVSWRHWIEANTELFQVCPIWKESWLAPDFALRIYAWKDKRKPKT